MVHGKTHFPSDILVEDVLSNPETTRELQLTKEQIGVLLKMVDHASSIEKQRSMPRYGWETRDKIIRPSEIYDEERAGEILGWSSEVLDATYAFFKSLGMKELKDVLESMERCSRIL